MPFSIYYPPNFNNQQFLILCRFCCLMNICYSCVLDPGDKIVDCPTTFTMYEFDATVNAIYFDIRF